MNGKPEPVTSRPDASELMAAEDAGWDELHALMDSLTREATEQVG